MPQLGILGARELLNGIKREIIPNPIHSVQVHLVSPANTYVVVI